MFVTGHLLFAVLSAVTALICGVLARFAWQRRSVAGAGEFAWLLVAIAVISLSAAADYVLSTNVAALKILATQLYEVGGAFASVLLLQFVLRYTHRDGRLFQSFLNVFWLFFAFGVLAMLTNEWHRLYWPAIYIDPNDPRSSLVYVHGPLNQLTAIVTYLAAFLAAGLIIYSAAFAPALYRLQYSMIVVALAVPVLANLVYYIGVSPWDNLDLTPISYIVSSLLMAWAIFRHQFLNLAPLAQDALFANLGDGVIAINVRGRIIAVNPAAQTLLGAGEDVLIGASASTLPPPWGETIADAYLADHGEHEVSIGDRSISISRSQVTTRHAQPVGVILLLHDVTQYRILQDELVHLNSVLEQRVAERTAELGRTVTRLQDEIEERQRAETTLRHIQESLADHITGLSRYLSVLYEVILLGGRSLDLDEVRRLTINTATNALHADAGFIFNYLSRAKRFELASQQGFSGEEIARLVSMNPAWIVDDPIPRTILHLHETAADIPASVQIAGMQACILTTLYRMGTPVGALGVYWRKTPSLSVEEIALFRALSDQFAILGENVRLRNEREQALVQEERKRIARDLHDSVTQSLYALTLSADTAAVRLGQGQIDDLSTLMARISTAANQSLREIRLLLYELRLATPDAMPLADALQLRLDAVETRAGIDATLEVDLGLVCPPTVASALYWIAVEALNNSLKHAAARHVTVKIRREASAIELSVTDDGIGLAAQAGNLNGFGLRSMAERAAQLGGVMSLDALPAGGVRVVVQAPLALGAEANHKMAEAET